MYLHFSMQWGLSHTPPEESFLTGDARVRTWFFCRPSMYPPTPKLWPVQQALMSPGQNGRERTCVTLRVPRHRGARLSGQNLSRDNDGVDVFMHRDSLYSISRHASMTLQLEQVGIPKWSPIQAQIRLEL